jgi:hypothetical protein
MLQGGRRCNISVVSPLAPAPPQGPRGRPAACQGPGHGRRPDRGRATQLAIGRLTAGLDSPRAGGVGRVGLDPGAPARPWATSPAGVHTVSRLPLQELRKVTGQQPAATLQTTCDPGRDPARDTLRRVGQRRLPRMPGRTVLLVCVPTGWRAAQVKEPSTDSWRVTSQQVRHRAVTSS